MRQNRTHCDACNVTLSKQRQRKHLRKGSLVLCPTCQKNAAHSLHQVVLLLREGVRQIATATNHGWDITSHGSLDSFGTLAFAVVQHLWITKHIPCTALLHHISAFMAALEKFRWAHLAQNNALNS